MEGQPNLEIKRPRSAFELIGATFALYRRFPWLFLVLAAMVIVPYRILDAIPASGLVHGTAGGLLSFAFGIGEIALVLPLISALHVYAVDDVREGRLPVIGSVARRGLATLSVVSPAVLLTWLGVVVGLMFLIVPGVILALRWAVVAQTASLGAKGWKEALERSRLLTRKRYRHVFAVLLLVFVITALPSVVLFPIFDLKTTVASFLVEAAISIPVSSFNALAIAFLYFDLTARDEAEPAEPQPDVAAPAGPPGDPLTPEAYSDEDRPQGWYVDPEDPGRMHYWFADGAGVWSEQTAKTPNRTLGEWRRLRGSGPE